MAMTAEETSPGKGQGDVPGGPDERKAELAAAWALLAGTAMNFERRIRNEKVQADFDSDRWLARFAARLETGSRVTIDEALGELIEAAFASGVHITHPRHFGLFNPHVWPSAVLGEAVSGLFNFQLSTDHLAPFACALERWTLKQLGDRCGGPWPAAQFTNGGSEANLTAVACALAWKFPELPVSGWNECDARPRLYVGAEAHDSFVKCGKLTGIGARHVVKAPAGPNGRTDVQALERLVEEDISAGLVPFMIVSTLGATATGTLDPTDSLADLAKRHGAWFHVDAAWGGGAVLSSKRRHLFDGVERADSLTWDAHKWMGVPLPTGMFFMRHPQCLTRAFDIDADYMPLSSNADFDLFRSSIPWSRRALGFKVFLALVSRGWQAYEEQVEHQFHIGDVIRERLRESGWRVLNETQLPLVCFNRAGLEDQAGLRALADRVIRSGEAWLSYVRMSDGRHAIRACVTSPKSTEEDVGALVSLLTDLSAQTTRPERV